MKIEKFYNKRQGREQFRTRFEINKRVFRPTADTKRDLLAIVDEIRANEHRLKYDLAVARRDVTLRDALAAVSATLNPDLKNHRRRRRVLEEFGGEFDEDFSIFHLGTADIRRWVEKKRQTSNLKPWSVHSLLTIVSSALNDATEIVRELADWRPPRIPWVKLPSDGAGRVITDEERAKLLAALRAPRQKIPAKMSKSGKSADRLEQLRDVHTRHELADMFEIALNTGMRWGEIVRIEWRWITLGKAAVVRLPKEVTKTGKARPVYLNERAAEILERRQKDASTDWVFPNPDGTGYRKYYSKPLRTVAKRIELNYGQDMEGGFTPHSTRHTAGTLLVRLTDIKTAGVLLGHSSKKMTMLYAHSDDKLLREAADKLGRQLASEEPEKSMAVE